MKHFRMVDFLLCELHLNLKILSLVSYRVSFKKEKKNFSNVCVCVVNNT